MASSYHFVHLSQWVALYFNCKAKVVWGGDEFIWEIPEPVFNVLYAKNVTWAQCSP